MLQSHRTYQNKLKTAGCLHWRLTDAWPATRPDWRLLFIFPAQSAISCCSCCLLCCLHIFQLQFDHKHIRHNILGWHTLCHFLHLKTPV